MYDMIYFHAHFYLCVHYIMLKQVMAKIRKFAAENKIVFRIENYKNHLQQKHEERKEKIRYLLTYKAEKNLAESLKEYLDKVRSQKIK